VEEGQADAIERRMGGRRRGGVGLNELG
jgi:hypothetical protein